MLACVHDVCGNLGVRVIGISTGGDARGEGEALRVARSLGARALEIASVSESIWTVADPAGLVLLNGPAPANDLPGVVPDNAAGSAKLARELLELAAVIALKSDDPTRTDRGRPAVSYESERLAQIGKTVRVRCPIVLRGSIGAPPSGERLKQAWAEALR